MHLTDEQWAIIQPLIPPPSPAAGRGRPLIDERSVLNGILWKFCSNAPWCEMPSCYPSHQTCYRRYRQWRRLGVMLEIYGALYFDLCDRGGLDLQRAFQDGTFTLQRQGTRFKFILDPGLLDTWQLDTALLFFSLIAQKLKHEDRPLPYTVPGSPSKYETPLLTHHPMLASLLASQPNP